MKKLCLLILLLGVSGLVIAKEIILVNPDSSEQTRSLYEYLKIESGKGVLFGHENTFYQGLTINPDKKGQSDVLNSVGDFPAVFGFDFLLCEQQSPEKLKEYIEEAYSLGGIITVSDHMKNFTTGGAYNDTTKSVRNILPGGKDFEKYNKYMDKIAAFAKSLKSKDGKAIPIIYRPFHENHGSWFWWGAAFCTKAEYIALWRYTVDFLKSKGVNNFLYEYSPSGSFGGSRDEYLKRYPGDDYVDILGFDSYDRDTNRKWDKLMISDCQMLVKLADEKNKIAAIAETGVSSGIKIKDNPNKKWYSERMMNIILHDDLTRKIVYFLVWRNGNAGHFWVPFKNHPEYGNHEMLKDFQDFYKNPYTVFLKGLKNVYTLKDIKTLPVKKYLYFMNPLNRDTVTGKQKIIVRTDIDTQNIKSLIFSDSKGNIELNKDGDFYTAEWDPDVNSGFKNLSVTLTTKNGDKITDNVVVRTTGKLNAKSDVIDNFESYFDNEDLNDTYTRNSSGNILDISLIRKGNQNSLKYDYTLGYPNYAGINRAIDVNNDWTKFKGIEFNLLHQAQPVVLTIQINASGVPWEAHVDLETLKSQIVKLEFTDFILPKWKKGDFKMNLSKITQFSIYVGTDKKFEKNINETLVFSNIKLY